MIHAFSDSGLSFQPLLTTSLVTEFALLVPDLPGFGVSPRRLDAASLGGMADVLSDLIRHRTPVGAIGLVGHSLGAAIAVQVAQRLGELVRALVSIEGNLTEADAYFSGRAAEYSDPNLFKQQFAESIWHMAGDSLALRHYFGSLVFADADTMWRLGRNARYASRNDALGSAYRALACPKLYYWSEATSPEPTRRYLGEHPVPNQRYTGSSHWPMIDIPNEVARTIGDFFRLHLP